MLRGGGNSLGALPVAGVVGMALRSPRRGRRRPRQPPGTVGGESPPGDGADMVEHPALVRADAAGLASPSLDDTRASAG